jgi:hypothetical protein
LLAGFQDDQESASDRGVALPLVSDPNKTTRRIDGACAAARRAASRSS